MRWLLNKIRYLIFLAVALFSLVFYSIHVIERPVWLEKTPIVLHIPPHSSLDHIADLLHTQARYPYPRWFILYVRLHRDMLVLKAGEYQLSAHMSVRALLNHMVLGQVVVHHVTLLPGWTFSQVRQALAGAVSLKHTLFALNNREVAQRFSSHLSSPEGVFFPDTYAYTAGVSDMDILHKAHHKMQQVLKALCSNTPNVWCAQQYKLLIFASLLEKEAARYKVRRRIAGVISNRLQRHMHLDLDASVRFGLHLLPNQPLTRADMHVPSVYNTYLHYGLPATPIALPSRMSINAVLHSIKSRDIYFMTTRGGRFIFARLYATQRADIRRFL